MIGSAARFAREAVGRLQHGCADLPDLRLCVGTDLAGAAASVHDHRVRSRLLARVTHDERGDADAAGMPWASTRAVAAVQENHPHGAEPVMTRGVRP